MPNYYHQFSELVFARLTETEQQWTREILAMDPDEDLDREQLAKHVPGADLEYGWPGFEWSFHRDQPDGEPCLWIRSEESFCPENVAAFLRGFLRKFRPKGIVKFTWAGVCGRPVAGEFGGGWAVVSSRRIVFGDTWDAAAATVKRMKKGKKVHR